MSEDALLCKKCGTEIKEGDAFCSKCGTKLDSPAEVIPPEAKSKKSFSKTQINVITGLFFLGVGICLFAFVLNGAFHPPQQSIINNINFENYKKLDHHQQEELDYQHAHWQIWGIDSPVYSKTEIEENNYTSWNVDNNKNCQFICASLGSEFNSYHAPDGYTFLFVKVSIKNDGYTPISTNPIFWKITVDGVTYSNDIATYSFKDPLRLVDHGGKAIFDLIYIVQGHPDSVKLFYLG